MPPRRELLSYFTPGGNPTDRGWIRFPLHSLPRRSIFPTQSGDVDRRVDGNWHYYKYITDGGFSLGN